MGKIYCPLFLNPRAPNYVKRGKPIWCLILRSMFILTVVVPHVETVFYAWGAYSIIFGFFLTIECRLIQILTGKRMMKAER